MKECGGGGGEGGGGALPFLQVRHVFTPAFIPVTKGTGGLEGLSRADSTTPDVLPDGIDRTEENYKREILKLRIENERLKKNYTVRTNEAGEQEYVRLKPKNLK